MKILKLLIWTTILISLFSCRRDSISLQKPIVIKVSAGLKTEKESTRVWFGKTDANLNRTPNITSFWEPNDAANIHIAIKQGGITMKATNIKIEKIFDNYKKIIFSFTLPTGFNIDEAATIYGALGNNISLNTSEPYKIILPTSGEKLKDRLVVSFKEDVVNLRNFINVKFEHIYSTICLRLQNSTGDKYDFPAGSNKLKLTSANNWAINAEEYNMETGEISKGSESSEVEFFTEPNEYIMSHDIKEYWAVLSPRQGMTNNPALSLKQGIHQIATIDQQLGERNRPLEKAKTYYIAGRLSKKNSDTKLEFIPNSELEQDKIPPSIYLRTEKSPGSGNTISFAINAALEDQANVWIDLNNDGVRNSPEEDVKTFYPSAGGPSSSLTEYPLQSSEITIYGNINYLYCNNNELVELDITKDIGMGDLECRNNNISHLGLSRAKNLRQLKVGNNNLKTLNVSKLKNLIGISCESNKLQSLDVSNNPKLSALTIAGNSINQLDVSNNKNLTTLNFSNCGISEIDVSNNTNLTYLICFQNNLKSIDISKNTNLRQLWCHYNKLTSINVSKNAKLTNFVCRYNNDLTTIYLTSTQSSNIPSTWLVPSGINYSVVP